LSNEKGNENSNSKSIPEIGSKVEEKLGSKKNIKNSLFGNVEKEEKEKSKDNISLLGQENKIEDENRSSIFGKLANLFTRLYKSFEKNNNYNDDNDDSDDSDDNDDNDKIEQKKKSSDNNQSRSELFFSNIFSYFDHKNIIDKSNNISSSNTKNKENKKNEISLKDNLINFRENSNKDQSKIKVPENSLNEGKKIINQFQSNDSEKKLDDKNIKINCAIMEPKKKTFSINISRSKDISYLKLLICFQLNRNDNFYFLKTSSFCLLKNYCFIKETGTVEDCGIKDGDNIYIILKNIMRQYVDEEIK